MNRICVTITAAFIAGLALFVAVQAADADRTVSAQVAIHDYHVNP